ncbi:MAG: hypothetical protein KDE47_22100, partial [Caldilineaceae bacterium]|nr:hypothetical protein [Caldilineaceae bacterium]
NPAYAVTQWMATNNARPCGSKGFEDMSLLQVLNDVSQRTDGYGRQGVDQVPFIPANLLDRNQMTPAWLDQVWDQENPGIQPAAGNE